MLFAALVAAKVIGAGINYISQRKGARGVEREGEMERALYGQQADLLEEKATDAIARGREAEFRQRLRTRSLTGEQRSAYASQGVRLDVGTASTVIAQERHLGELDALMIRENAAREAAGLTAQAKITRGQGDLAYRAGRNQAQAARTGSLGSLVSFTGDMFDLFHRKRKGG